MVPTMVGAGDTPAMAVGMAVGGGGGSHSHGFSGLHSYGRGVITTFKYLYRKETSKLGHECPFFCDKHVSLFYLNSNEAGVKKVNMKIWIIVFLISGP
ncbi:hypothetical protein GCM10025859_30390 [Alicyclobacillus fastidiosus]|nr:hypothetical protein GCM10025859_30390 [Alicyclobacillus fastidiosus]